MKSDLELSKPIWLDCSLWRRFLNIYIYIQLKCASFPQTHLHNLHLEIKSHSLRFVHLTSLSLSWYLNLDIQQSSKEAHWSAPKAWRWHLLKNSSTHHHQHQFHLIISLSYSFSPIYLLISILLLLPSLPSHTHTHGEGCTFPSSHSLQHSRSLSQICSLLIGWVWEPVILNPLPWYLNPKLGPREPSSSPGSPPLPPHPIQGVDHTVQSLSISSLSTTFSTHQKDDEDLKKKELWSHLNLRFSIIHRSIHHTFHNQLITFNFHHSSIKLSPLPPFFPFFLISSPLKHDFESDLDA